VDGWRLAQTETFDPKRYTAFKTGLRCESVLSTFRPLTPRLTISSSQGLEDIARIGPRHADPVAPPGGARFILRSRHQFHWHTGYIPPQSVAAPHLGAVLARTQPAQSGSARLHRCRPESKSVRKATSLKFSWRGFG
jgi:hypothetical protein